MQKKKGWKHSNTRPFAASDEFKLRQAMETFAVGPMLDQIVPTTWPVLIKKKNLIKTSLSRSETFKGKTDPANPGSNTSIPHPENNKSHN